LAFLDITLFPIRKFRLDLETNLCRALSLLSFNDLSPANSMMWQISAP
jgi:hypothetical protein